MRLGDRSVLKWAVDRVALSKRIDKIVVATTTNPADDDIADFCEEHNLHCFRGSEDDVLGRFVAAAEAHGAAWAVRVNPDSPLIDPVYLDDLIGAALQSDGGYISYELSDHTPVMLCGVSFFAEAIHIDTLRQADKLIADDFEREHVTLGIYKRPETYRVRFLQVPSFCDDAAIRLTLDTETDFRLLQELVAVLGEGAISCSAAEIVDLLSQRPEWTAMMKSQADLNPKGTTSERE